MRCFLVRQGMIGGQDGDEPFVPEAARMAIGEMGYTSDEGDIELATAKLMDAVAGSAFGNPGGDVGMRLPVARKKVHRGTRRA